MFLQQARGTFSFFLIPQRFPLEDIRLIPKLLDISSNFCYTSCNTSERQGFYLLWMFGKYIAILNRQEHRYLNQQVQEYGFGPSVYLLFYLSKHEGISQKQLCETMVIDEAAMARSMKKLEQQGLVTRRKDTNDLRCYSLYLTPKGRDFIPTLTQFGCDFWDNVTKDFTEEQLVWFLSMCERMAENALQKNQEDSTK